MKLEIIPTKGILYDKCENVEQLYDNYYYPLLVEFKQLKKQLEYLRSGEYINQLKFERNMLEDIVQNSEISKEDKEFIDMTRRNTELLEENQLLKIQVSSREEVANKYKEVIEEVREYTEELKPHWLGNDLVLNIIDDLLQILDKAKENK